MYVLNAGNIKLNIEDLTAIITLEKSDRSKLIADIDDFNESKSKAFSLGVYEFKIITQTDTVNIKIPSEEVRKILASHNIFLPLFKDIDGNNLYACDNIDFSQRKDRWLRQIHEFMVETAKYNIETLKDEVRHEMKEQKIGYQRRVSDTLGVLNILEKAIPKAKEDVEEYLKSVCAADIANITISLKEISLLRYNKPTTRYGVEILVNDTKVLLYIGDKTQSILYMAALVRFKMGQPLYLHELYRNSHGLRSVYKREKTYKWFARIFDDLFGRTSSFEKWTTPIRNNQPTPRSGHDFNQAKSAVEDKLEALLVGNLASALDYCRLHSACDANGDTYYTFNCNPEDIILDETAQKWSILFKKLYSLR